MRAQSRMRPQGAARLQALTATAADMFLDQGYESVSLDELINRVGGSRRNVYSHFGGKHGLFVEVVTRLCDENARPLEELNIASSDATTALTLFGRRTLEIVLRPRTLELHRLMVAEGKRFPELAQAIWRSGHDKATQLLAAWIAGRSELRQHGEPEVLAGQFIELLVTRIQLEALVGLHPQARLVQEIDHTVDTAVSTFLHGVLVPEHGYA